MGLIDGLIFSMALIGVAELGDKTQIALLSLSGKYQNRVPLLVGSFLGFAFVDGIAVVFGGAISSFFP